MRFIAVLALLLGLLGSGDRAFSADALSDAQTAAVNQLIHDYLMKNPKVLSEALQNAEQAAKDEDTANKQKSIGLHRDELEHDPSTPILGNPNGTHTLVEFFDYRCPYCKASAATVEKLIDTDKDVRVVVKDFPVLGPDSVYASRVALVAQKHGKYAEFYRAMFALPQKVTPETTLEVAKSLGLDLVQVKMEMQSPEIDAVLKRNYELGQTLGVDGTPAFVLGDIMAPGAISFDEMERLVAQAKAVKS